MVTGRVSIIIPGRCEVYFQQTIDGILGRAKGDIEIIAVVDGYVPDPPLVARDERVKIIHLKESIGQRAGYNLGVRESTGEYVMKLDAHAAVSEGFDVELKKHCSDTTTVIPEMRRLDVKKWEPKRKGRTRFMYFGTDLYCYYWRPYRKRPEAKGDYPELLTGQGSCWFMKRTWNDHIGLLDEGIGSWGKVGIEISLRTWLCGGTQIVNKKVWQAHYFRLSDGGFPYPFSGRQVTKARNYVTDNYFFKDNAFENQVRSFGWLMEKFAPIPGWEVYAKDKYRANRVVVYYSPGEAEETLLRAARKNLTKAAAFIPIISVTEKPVELGRNIVVPFENAGYVDLYRRMLAGVEAAPPNSIVYLAEDDVFYHPSHFAKIPRDKNAIYFNQNRYYWRVGNSSFLPAKGKQALSQGVAYREYWLEHIRKRLTAFESDPVKAKMNCRWFKFKSDRPNVDIRHGNNFTKDGRYKRQYYDGSSKHAVRKIGAWGGAKHFMSKSGYKGVMRYDIINCFIKDKGYEKYLEIGVRKPKDCLDRIRCEHKDGIDPAGKCNYAMTSDVFFETTPQTQKYDLIFIDGLHEAHQVDKDIVNSLGRLNEGGTIVMHDCHPRNEQEQLVPKVGRPKGWTGDVWKSFVRARKRDDLTMYVVDTNNGIGVIQRGRQEPLTQPENLTFSWLVANKQNALNLISVSEFNKVACA